MRFSEVDFRILDDTMIVLPAAELKDAYDTALVSPENDMLLAYCYIDRLKGLTLAVLTSGRKEGERFVFDDPDTGKTAFIRLSGLGECEFEFYEEDDDRFFDAVSAISLTDDEDLLMTRSMEFLDGSRRQFDPDVVNVLLKRKNAPDEECPVRIVKADDHRFIGTLEETPKQSSVYRAGDPVIFFVSKKEDGKIYCIADLTFRSVMTKAELEDGSVLKNTIHAFNQDQNENSFAELLQVLRDSELWIPVKNDTLLSANEKDLIPGLLQRNDYYFLPVFTSTAEMGDGAKKQPRIRLGMLKTIELAEKNEVTGIVVNPFTEPFILQKKLFKDVASMKSLLMKLD